MSHSLHFADADPEEERGRSIGFVIASIVAGPLQTADSVRAGQPEPQPSPREAKPHPFALAPNKFTLSLAAVGTVPDAANSFGAYGDGTRDLSPYVGIGVYAEARFGAVGPAQASTRFVSAGAVGRFRLVPLGSHTALSLIANFGITQLAVTHFSEDDATPASQWAYAAQGIGALRLTYHFANLAAFYGDLGVMTLAGEMTIRVHGRSAGSIPMLFPMARLGLQARF